MKNILKYLMLALVLICGNNSQSCGSEDGWLNPKKCSTYSNVVNQAAQGSYYLVAATAAVGAGYVWYNYFPHWAQVATGVVAGAAVGTVVATAVVMGAVVSIGAAIFSPFFSRF